MIESKKDPIDAKYVVGMQADNKNFNAENILPYLMEVDLENDHLNTVRNIFAKWNYQESMDSAPAALFEVFWKHLIEETFYDELPANLHPGGGSRWMEVIRIMLKNPNDPWWNNQRTDRTEHRDDILREAFAKSVTELENAQGKDSAQWQWGKLHTVTFRSQSFGESGITLLERLFNRGPYAASGGTVTVNSTSWETSGSYEVSWVPSMRMIIDLSNLNHSLAIHTTGQSGHPFHRHYIDMADQWRKIEYDPMLWDRSQVEANAEATLQLLP